MIFNNPRLILFDVVLTCAINDIHFKMICGYGIIYVPLSAIEIECTSYVVLNITFLTLILHIMLCRTKMAKRQKIFI